MIDIYTLHFDGRPGDTRDVLAHALIEDGGGVVLGGGVFLLSNPPLRDIEFSVPKERAPALVSSLVEAGFEPELRT